MCTFTVQEKEPPVRNSSDFTADDEFVSQAESLEESSLTEPPHEDEYLHESKQI